jgi:hypothetical protein
MQISLAVAFCALQYDGRVKFGSSFCRVTGVSSLNLARRSNELAGFFLLERFHAPVPGSLGRA